MLSPGLEYEKALRIDNRLKEVEVSTYLNSLDRTDRLLIRDIYYLFCGGGESKEEKAISKILENRKGVKKKMKKYRCCDCGKVFTGWGVGEICQKCGGKLELVIEEEKPNESEGANKSDD